MALIKNLMGRLKSIGSSPVENDLSRLNTLKAGVGDLAAKYVQTGSDETVLSTLTTLGDNGLLNICYGYEPFQDKISPARCKFIAGSTDKSFDIICRYVDVLDALTSTLSDNALGSKHVPKKASIFFTELFNGDVQLVNEQAKQTNTGSACALTLDPTSALKYCEAFDATVVDLFDVLYNSGNGYYRTDTRFYRKRFDLKQLAVNESSAFFEACLRLSAEGKTRVVEEIVSWSLVETPEFLQFVLSIVGQSAKEPRSAALNALKTVSAKTIEPLAVEHLQKGTVAVRSGMVELLTLLGTQTALDAMLAHKANEKTARIVAAIDNVAMIQASSDVAAGSDSGSSYTSTDGGTVSIPELRPLLTGGAPAFGDADRQVMKQAIEQANEKIRLQNIEAKKTKHNYQRDLHKLAMIDQVLDFFSGKKKSLSDVEYRQISHYCTYSPVKKWATEALTRLPQDKAVPLCVQMQGARNVFGSYSFSIFTGYLRSYLNSEGADLRHLERIELALNMSHDRGPWGKRVSVSAKKGDLARQYLSQYYDEGIESTGNLREAVWPFIVTNIDALDEAMGLKPVLYDTEYYVARALNFIEILPKPPMRYLGPLLEFATGSRKQGREESKAMLVDVPEVNDRLLVLIKDSRQDIRAGTAQWIAERDFKEATPTIHAQLKKEKSPVAKAAFLTTLRHFGENLDSYIGAEALLIEATTGLKKAKMDSLAWLLLEHAPTFHYQNGDVVPAEVIQWWCFLAVKLKQPAGNGLFELYQEQLRPQDAEALSAWVLHSWIQYDTAKPEQADAIAHAKANVKQRLTYYIKWQPDYTEERAFDDLKREFSSEYLNSGAATKGLLAFARFAPSAEAADKVRAYLKSHGSRTSQASPLLEVLAAKGDAVSLQVVISAATRLKQKGVQKLAGELLETVAERKNWTLDELADRTVPTAGMDDDGIIDLICSEQQKHYKAHLDDNLTVVIQNPDGKTVKGLPAGTDDNTKAAKKQLSASKKEIKQVVAMQGGRLYEAVCSERIWSAEEWQTHYQQHPLMRKLIERLVWLGLDAEGVIIGAFRPTAEGDFTDAEDNDVNLGDFAQIRLAHGVLLTDEQVTQWNEHLNDYEVTLLFKQFGRPLLRIENDSKQIEINDRVGYVTNTFALRGETSKLGYERGAAEDGGVFWEYNKTFRSAGLVAVIEFSGNCLPEENVPAALTNLYFVTFKNNNRRNTKVKLSEVPPVLLSECWNDYHDMVAKSAFDKDWEKKMPWM